MEIQNRASWSVGLGRWGGVPVRLHMLFFVFAAVTFYFGWYATNNNHASVGEFTALTSLIILFGSVTLHEFGHLFFVSRSQCRIHLIELLPWGGCSRFDSPRDPTGRLLIHIAGPTVNLMICAICCMLLLIQGQSNGLAEIAAATNPIRPVGLLDQDFGMCVIKLGLWINWVLFLINMIPVFPFDGGNILRSLVLIVWRKASPHQAYLICLMFAQLAALCLFISAWVLRDSNPNELIPTWFVLVMLGIIVFFSSKRQATLDGQHLEQVELARASNGPFLMPDGDGDYIDLEESLDDEGTISDWLHQHKIDREVADYFSEEEEDRLVDEILEKLHVTGINSLSERENRILQRVSARYRNRHKESRHD